MHHFKCLSAFMPGIVLSLALISQTTQAAIESDFDDGNYPGTVGRGWGDTWVSSGGLIPEIISDDPIDSGSPYLHVDFLGTPGGYRNVLRTYESGGGINAEQTHRISWKFRLDEPPADFDNHFTTFDDRVHFFARNAPRAEAGTDASTSWAVFAHGDAHASGVAAGRTFWIYDNATGDSGFNTDNAVDTGVALIPNNNYAFAVTINPEYQLYTVSITNEDTAASFTSTNPHRFRDLSATLDSHRILHFGIRADGDEFRAFDLDTVTIEQALGEVPIPPQIVDLFPFNLAVIKAEEGIQFQVVSENPVQEADISLVLNGTDVSDQLLFTGTPSQWDVIYAGLTADTAYTGEISVTSAGGMASQNIQFWTVEDTLTLFDSGGFEDDTLYPVGPLGNIIHDASEWFPAGVPAEIMDLNDGQFEKVLHRLQVGNDNSDVLEFPATSTGILSLVFDARVSNIQERTIDICLLPQTGGNMAGFLGWGINPGQLSVYDGSAWVAITPIDTEWHRYEAINYLSGPLAETFTLIMDGEVIQKGLPWRNSFPPEAAFGRLRISGMRGVVGDFGQIDNLVITAAAEPPPPPTIENVFPAHRAHFQVAEDGIQFETLSSQDIPTEGITLLLNGVDVSGGLIISGDPNHRMVQYQNLQPNQIYTAEIQVSNETGDNARTVQFDTIRETTVIFDVGGFEDPVLYPLGTLQNVTDGLGVWTAGRSGVPAEIVDSGEAQYNKILQRTQAAEESTDILDFSPFSAGILTIELDVRVSDSLSRTLDLALNRTGQTQRAAFLSWGEIPGKIGVYDGANWNEVADLDQAWHHYTIINYLDGPNAQTFDLKIDGELVGEGLPWDLGFPAGTPYGRMRIGAVNGLEGEYADVDNLQISVTPPPPAIVNLNPAFGAAFHPANQGLQFQVQSPQPVLPEDIHLTLNGQDVSSALVIEGDPTNLTVSYMGLAPNLLYQGEILAENALGSAQTLVQFDTFSGSEAMIVEAEDYNYDGGDFQDDPPPSGFTAEGGMVNGDGVGYLDLMGTSEIDYFVSNPSGQDPQLSYRIFDDVATRPTDDFLRDKYVQAGVSDYEVLVGNPGDWTNYTRTFKAGEVNVLLRAASTKAQTVTMAEVTANPDAINQQTMDIGSFEVPDTQGKFVFIALTNPQGMAISLDLDGVHTFRLTAESAEEDLLLNFLSFAPAGGATLPVEISELSYNTDGFRLGFLTEPGTIYTVQYRSSLSVGAWETLGSLTGNGAVMEVHDPAIGESQRFYRVLAE